MMNFMKICSLAMAAVVCTGLSVPAFAESSYNDFDYITSHVNLKVPSKLSLTRPTADLTTSAQNYFLTGNSSPDQALTLNGEKITTRGTRGSFGIFVALDAGENTFVFQQGDTKKSITITRGKAGSAAKIKNIRRMTPAYDCATTSGGVINLSCEAPSGASVTATVGGRSVQLTQQAATAQAGVPAIFSAKITAGDVSGTKNLGAVVYTLNGQANYTSGGSVFVAGGKLVVQVRNNAASIYKDASKSAFIETAHRGALDSVAEIGGELYRLSSGGWIPKDSVQPLTQNPALNNQVSSVTFEQSNGGEYFSFDGGSKPMYRADHGSDGLTVKFFNTSADSVACSKIEALAAESALFSSISAVSSDGVLTLKFQLSGDRTLWGYDIQYNKGGGMYVFAKYAPKRSSGSTPLKGMTIAVDAGHGGTDPGAIGLAANGGAVEKDITLASAIAVQKRLESLGATVLMCRENDSDISMNTRMDDTRKVYADLFISMHCNSIDFERDVNKIGGTEVYYFENIAQKFAATISAKLSSNTGRSNRGAKLSNYRVTLNSFAPSVLVEMGFLTNAAEYDSMTSRQGIFATANAVGDSVLACFA